MDLYAKIRHAVMVDGLSRREAAKRFGVHRNTITKMLSFSVPPGYRRRERPASKKLGHTFCGSGEDGLALDGPWGLELPVFVEGLAFADAGGTYVPNASTTEARDK